jgi:putative tryptophan/tyrosine transport system substrate-binding protein
VTELGWKVGGNIELEYRWPGAELDQVSIAANEIVAMRPDLVVSRSTPTTAIMMNRGVPIVFVLVTDPLFSGFVQSLGRPGGSVTGFSVFESSVGGKWLALLKEAAPAVSRVSLLFNPETAPFRGELSAINGGRGADSWHNRCRCALWQRDPHRKCV